MKDKLPEKLTGAPITAECNPEWRFTLRALNKRLQLYAGATNVKFDGTPENIEVIWLLARLALRSVEGVVIDGAPYVLEFERREILGKPEELVTVDSLTELPVKLIVEILRRSPGLVTLDAQEKEQLDFMPASSGDSSAVPATSEPVDAPKIDS